MEILFLGTGSMVPTKERNHSGIFLTLKNQGILIDCGEGTQRQLKIAGINPVKINKILITHWHGDHTLGLAGLLQTLSSSSNTYPGTLEIYGPQGIVRKIGLLKQTFDFELTFDMRVIEAKPGIIFENEEYRIESAQLDHSVLSMGYSIIEQDVRHIRTDVLKKLKIPDGPHLKKLQAGEDIVYKGTKVTSEMATKLKTGKKITTLFDTAICKSGIELAHEADLLIAEATYANSLQKKAEQYKHMTAGHAAQIANTANVKQLILTHFSQRYKDTQQIEEDASEQFDNVISAKDFMKVRV